jgi:hypothetical protein
MAKVFYQQKSYNRSLEVLFDLNKNFGSYPYWIGKSFLLISDNYIAMGELLQAKATLNSIIANSLDKEVVAEAQRKLVSVATAEKSVLAQDTVVNEANNKVKQ